MRKASGVIRPAATDQREEKKYKEERGRERKIVPLGRVECVCYGDSQRLHRVATPFLWNCLDNQGQQKNLQKSMYGEPSYMRGR